MTFAWNSGSSGVRAGKCAPGSGTPMPLMAGTLLTLVLNPTGTDHFYCQSILGLYSCGNKSFFQSSLFNLARVCACVCVGGCLHKCIIFNLPGVFQVGIKRVCRE